MNNLLTGVSMVSTKCTVGQCVGTWTGTATGSFVSNVCEMQFWWFVEYVFRYFFSLYFPGALYWQVSRSFLPRVWLQTSR